MENFSYRITQEHAGHRLDRFLGEQINHISREKIKKAIQEGQCLVDGLPMRVPGTKLRPGQTVELSLLSPVNHVHAEEGDIEVLWHDEHVLLLNKAPGITVHPCPSCPEGTLVQRLASHFPQLMEQEGLRPGIVHRLDKDTSGLLAVALTEKARLRLAADFAERRVHKEYLALVHGVPPVEGEIHEPLGRHPLSRVKMAVVPASKGGREAHSQWHTLYADPAGLFALISVRIHTGRTHQIRVHMAHVGFPLWGDAVYGPQDKSSTSTPGQAQKKASAQARKGASAKAPPTSKAVAPRQMLHAWKLSLAHPETDEECSFHCPPPPDMLACALALSQRMRRVVITGLPGCGKSALLHLLEEAGLPVWSADKVVNALYAPGNAGHDFLLTRFGSRFVPQHKANVDKEALRKAMEQDAFLRQEVECAIHALVRQSLIAFWHSQEEAAQAMAVAEVPLWLETGWGQPSQEQAPQGHEAAPPTLLVGVRCSEATRHARLAASRQWTQAQCLGMDQWQWPEERKMKACAYIVDNSSDFSALAEGAQDLIRHLKEEKERESALLTQTLQSLWGRARADAS